MSWKPRIGDSYFSICESGLEFQVVPRIYRKSMVEQDLKTGNYFKTEEQAQKALRAIKKILKAEEYK